MKRLLFILLFIPFALCSQTAFKNGALVTKNGAVANKGGGTPVAHSNTNFLSTDGTANDYLTFGTELNPSTTYSLSFWMRFPENTGEFAFGHTTSGHYVRVYTSTIYYRAGASGEYLNYSIISTGEWHHYHIAHESDDSTKLYVDGTLEAVGYNTNLPDWTYIARRQIYQYDLDIDQVVFCDGDLPTQADITNMATFDGTDPGDYDIRLISAADLTHSFDDITSFPTIPDGTGSNHGTYNGDSADIESY